MYQEDYFGLLNATEAGARVSYDPTSILSITESFSAYVTAAISEVLTKCVDTKNSLGDCDYQQHCIGT